MDMARIMLFLGGAVQGRQAAGTRIVQSVKKTTWQLVKTARPHFLRAFGAITA